MTPKQRVRMALARKKPDRLPSAVSFNTVTQGSLFRIEGLSAIDKIKAYLDTDDFEKVEERLGTDIRPIGPRSVDSDNDKKQKLEAFVEGLKSAETVADLKSLEWPTWDLMWDASHLKEDIEKILGLKMQYALYMGGPGIWEVARGWRGFTRIMVDWMTDPEFVITLFEIIYNLYMPAYEVYAEVLGDLKDQIDFIYGGSDIAMQDRLMVSPELISRDYQPFIERKVKKFNEIFPGAIFEYHCCGAVAELLPVLVKSGVKCIHPVQPGTRGMDFEELKRNWGGKLTFRGGVDAQGVLAHGSTEDVRKFVLYAFNTLGRDGGYILSPHGIMPDVPVENILAMFDTVQNECWY